LRSCTSGYSISIVAFQLLPSGTNGAYASISPTIPSSSKIFSMCSISWIWRRIVFSSSKSTLMCSPR
jgi:hypothetical protein